MSSMYHRAVSPSAESRSAATSFTAQLIVKAWFTVIDLFVTTVADAGFVICGGAFLT